MTKQTSPSTFALLGRYMGKKKGLIPISITISAIAGVVAMAPLVCIWLIITSFLKGGAIVDGSVSETVIRYAWWAFGFSIAYIVLYFLAITLSHIAGFRVENGLREEAMKRMVKMPLGFFNQNTIGVMRKIVDENAAMVHGFTAHQIPDLAGALITFIASLAMIFIFDWRFGLASFILLLGAVLAFFISMQKSTTGGMQKYMKMLEAVSGEAVEYVRGIPVIKTFQQSLYSFKRFYDAIINYKKYVIEYTFSFRHSMCWFALCIFGFPLVLIPLAVILILMGESWIIILPNLILYLLITPLFGECFQRIMNTAYNYNLAGEAVHRVEELLNESKLQQRPLVLKPANKDNTITFNNVSFAYEKDKPEVLNNISFEIPEGQIVALVGASGSGKTTIARLVARFWDVTKGKVSIGGTDVRNISSDELMQRISFVFQNTTLFKTTIRENIVYGSPNATADELNQAIDAAQCQDIIAKLPDGIDTALGADGIYLSGGEQQRIVLARAFLKNAPIVLLDEATAFADPENERQIQLSLKQLMKGKTGIFIAHRLNSVMDADRIIVIDKGCIAEQGTHAELLAIDGIYCRMWNEYQKSLQWTIEKNKETK